MFITTHNSIFEDRVFKLGRKILLIFKLKCPKFEQDPFNIKDFRAQNVFPCLPEGYSKCGFLNCPVIMTSRRNAASVKNSLFTAFTGCYISCCSGVFLLFYKF